MYAAFSASADGAGSVTAGDLENDRRLIYRRLAMDEREYARTSEVMFGSIPFTEEIMEFEEAENTVLQAGIVNDFIQAVTQHRKAICPVEDAVRSLHIINGAYLSSWKKTEVSFPIDMEAYRQTWAQKAGQLLRPLDKN